MNCANHSDLAAVAFCRTCGKPLCQSCTRDVRGVIYCESCLAAKLEGSLPAAGFVPTQPPYQQGAYQQVVPPIAGAPGARLPLGSGPNPAVAGILAGFFPIGVGAVYCSQYAKGLAYLVIMVLLGYGTDHAGGLGGLFIAAFLFFWVFQIIDAVRTAKAIQTGEPIPDPLGIGQAFGSNTGTDKIDVSKIPVGAVILIGLGVLFLLHTMGMWEFGFDRFWPLIIVALGGFMFYRQWERPSRLCHCSRCRFRGIMGPALVLTTGILLLLHSTDVADMGRTWPAWILVVGVIKLMQSSASTEGHVGPLPPGPGSYPPPNPMPPVPPPAGTPQDSQQPPSSGEVNHV